MLVQHGVPVSGQGTPNRDLHVLTMRVDSLDEEGVTPWLGILDQTERNRAERFVHEKHRVQYIAAHVLARVTLGRIANRRPAAIRFRPLPNGKPVAFLDDSRATLSFNLSHTEGAIGIAVSTEDLDIGFDIEPASRFDDGSVAESSFVPQELSWLASPGNNDHSSRFARLWTLKEAFAKAVGQGLQMEFTSFWFDMDPIRLHFAQAPDLLKFKSTSVRLEQRLVEDLFIASVCMIKRDEREMPILWSSADPDQFRQWVLSSLLIFIKL